jgi:hypothetical protein
MRDNYSTGARVSLCCNGWFGLLYSPPGAQPHALLVCENGLVVLRQGCAVSLLTVLYNEDATITGPLWWFRMANCMIGAGVIFFCESYSITC